MTRIDPEKYADKRREALKFVADQARKNELTEQKIADETGFQQSNVHRMLSAKYAPSLDNFLLLCEAVGIDVILARKDYVGNEYDTLLTIWIQDEERVINL